MDSFNRIISFVLGLVVVLVFFAVVTGKIKLPGNFKPLSIKSSALTPTLTPTPISTVRINEDKEKTEKTSIGNIYKNQAKTIPSTGLPTMFIPSILASGLGGFFLSKTGKK